MATRSFLDKAGLDALWALIKTAINTLVGLVNGKVSKDGDTMSGNLDMDGNDITHCGNLYMTSGGEIDLDEGGISNCTYIEGGGDNDTVEFQSKIDASGNGFWNGTTEGTNTDIVLGNGGFVGIRDEMDTGDSVYEYDEKIPTSEAVYHCINGLLYDYAARKPLSVKYAELKTLRDNGSLFIGQWYRITDFVTTVGNYSDVQSAGHVFDLLVFATSSNTLSETAFADRSSDDDFYFADSKLTAWELRYCLDNDTTRFSWANTSTGKGVIYYMKDEFGNSAPYDFKNIQYKVSFVDSAKCTPTNAYNATKNRNINLLISSNSTYYYTFSSSSGADLSLSGAAHNNTIKENISNKKRYLNFIVFKAPSIRRVSCEYGCQYISVSCSSAIEVISFGKNTSYVYVSCNTFQFNKFDEAVDDIVIYVSNGNYFFGYFNIASNYIVIMTHNHCRGNTFKNRTYNICLYGGYLIANCFDEEVHDFAWIEQATFSNSSSTLPNFTNTPAISGCNDEYFMNNHIYPTSGWVYIGIPVFISNNFTGTVEYLVLNKQSSATYAVGTPTHYLHIDGGQYGSRTGYGILTPPNDSASTVFIRKRNVTTIEV